MKKVMLKNFQELLIRKAANDDASAMVEFKQRISEESDFLSFGINEIEISEETEQQIIQSENESANSVILLAFCNGEIAGFVTFHGGTRIRKQHAGEMGIAVRKKYWGLGIGNFLLDALILWAKDTKIVRKINLLTRADNEKAIMLYEKYGFKREGIIVRDICIHGAFYDSVSMGLLIN